MSTMPPFHPLHGQLTTSLQTRHNLPVNPQWLNTFLTSRGPTPPPLPALLSTAHFRILASDITTSILPTTATESFPNGADDVNVKERQLQGNVIVQVLDVLDVGSSKWSQIEAIERVERGEEVRGREVIRAVGGMDGDDDDGNANANGQAGANGGAASTQIQPPLATNPAPTTSNNNTNSTAKKLSTGPHKLLIQDSRGTKVPAFELEKTPKIGIPPSAGATLPASLRNQGAPPGNGMTAAADDPGMFIGCKLLLRSGTVIRRGMVMLTPDNCVVLGGKVEAWDKMWKEERKQKLTALIAEENAGGRG
jgi:RecQ-mediated genome instability protein 1